MTNTEPFSKFKCIGRCYYVIGFTARYSQKTLQAHTSRWQQSTYRYHPTTDDKWVKWKTKTGNNNSKMNHQTTIITTKMWIHHWLLQSAIKSHGYFESRRWQKFLLSHARSTLYNTHRNLDTHTPSNHRRQGNEWCDTRRPERFRPRVRHFSIGIFHNFVFQFEETITMKFVTKSWGNVSFFEPGLLTQ